MAASNGPVAGERSPAAARRRDWVEWRERHDRPLYAATLWPNRALDVRGHRVVVGIAAAGLALPVLAFAPARAALWLLPFALGALWMLWAALRRNAHDGRLSEEVQVWRDEMRVERREPDGRVRRWSADPWEVRLTLHPEGRVEQYLTVRGSGREIELGAFLSPDERVALAAELEEALTRAIRG